MYVTACSDRRRVQHAFNIVVVVEKPPKKTDSFLISVLLYQFRFVRCLDEGIYADDLHIASFCSLQSSPIFSLLFSSFFIPFFPYFVSEILFLPFERFDSTINTTP